MFKVALNGKGWAQSWGTLGVDSLQSESVFPFWSTAVGHCGYLSEKYKLTLKAPITTVADDIRKHFLFFRENKT